jgi:hypothetical protein
MICADSLRQRLGVCSMRRARAPSRLGVQNLPNPERAEFCTSRDLPERAFGAHAFHFFGGRAK